MGELLVGLDQTKKVSRDLRGSSASVSLVLTAGKLHRGHQELIARSARENDKTIVAVYVQDNRLYGSQVAEDSVSRDADFAFGCGATFGVDGHLARPGREPADLAEPSGDCRLAVRPTAGRSGLPWPDNGADLILENLALRQLVGRCASPELFAV